MDKDTERYIKKILWLVTEHPDTAQEIDPNGQMTPATQMNRLLFPTKTPILLHVTYDAYHYKKIVASGTIHDVFHQIYCFYQGIPLSHGVIRSLKTKDSFASHYYYGCLEKHKKQQYVFYGDMIGDAIYFDGFKQNTVGEYQMVFCT